MTIHTNLKLITHVVYNVECYFACISISWQSVNIETKKYDIMTTKEKITIFLLYILYKEINVYRTKKYGKQMIQ